MITSLEYDKGYAAALMDVHNWFDTPSKREQCKWFGINQRSLKKILFCFFEHRNKFMREREEFSFRAKFDEKKKTTIIKIEVLAEGYEEKIRSNITGEQIVEESREEYFRLTGIRL